MKTSRRQFHQLTGAFLASALLSKKLLAYEEIERSLGAGEIPELNAEDMFYQVADGVVRPGTEEYLQTVLDPYYGYRLIILVDKSEFNPQTERGQTLHAYEIKDPSSAPDLIFSSPVSTGREYFKMVEVEGVGKVKSWGHTPNGFFNMERLPPLGYVSNKFRVALPHFAVYHAGFGVGFHAAEVLEGGVTKDILGKRASAGCTRMPPLMAEILYNKVKSIGKGPIVKLDPSSGDPVMLGRNPRVIDSFRTLVINCCPAGYDETIEERGLQSAERIDPLVTLDPEPFRKNPEKLLELFPALQDPSTEDI